MKEVSLFIARDIYCLCPYCNEIVDGWFGDPRDEETKCDWCGREFKVAEDIDIDMY